MVTLICTMKKGLQKAEDSIVYVAVERCKYFSSALFILNGRIITLKRSCGLLTCKD